MNRNSNWLRNPTLWVTLLAAALMTSVAFADDDDRGSGNSKGRIQALESAVNSLSNRVEVQQQLIESLQLDIEEVTGIFTPPSFVFVDSVTIEEGRSLAVSVALSKPSVYQVMVDYSTVDGTAIAGQDYEGAFGTLVFEPGTTVQEIAVDTVDNYFIGTPTKNFQILLSNPLYAELSKSTVDVAVEDTEDKPFLYFTITETAYEPPTPVGSSLLTHFRAFYQFIEGPYADVCRSNSVAGTPYAPPEPVQLSLALRQDLLGLTAATEELDFRLPEQIEFPAGVPSGSVDFGVILEDDIVEGDEWIYFYFFGGEATVIGDAVINGRCTKRVRIVDEDQ